MHKFDRDVDVVDTSGRREITAKDKDLLHAIEIVVVFIYSTDAGQKVCQLPLGGTAS